MIFGKYGKWGCMKDAPGLKKELPETPAYATIGHNKTSPKKAEDGL